MELLRRGMLPIQLDDIFGLHRKVGPPALEGEIRRQEELAVSIDGPFDYPDDALEGIRSSVDLFSLLHDHGAYPLACSGRRDHPLGKHPVAPGDDIAVPGIPFDDVVSLLGIFQSHQGLRGIVA